MAAVILVVAGLAMAALGGRGAAGPATAPDPKPALAGLGDRVSGILALAEQQAADHRAEARRDAERIVADAHAEADRIRNG